MSICECRSDERSWENYRANQERLKRVGSRRRRRDKGEDIFLRIIATAILIGIIAFFVLKGYI